MLLAPLNAPTANRLADLGARPWQIATTASMLSNAFLHPEPLELKKPKHDDEHL